MVAGAVLQIGGSKHTTRMIRETLIWMCIQLAWNDSHVINEIAI